MRFLCLFIVLAIFTNQANATVGTDLANYAKTTIIPTTVAAIAASPAGAVSTAVVQMGADMAARAAQEQAAADAQAAQDARAAANQAQIDLSKCQAAQAPASCCNSGAGFGLPEYYYMDDGKGNVISGWIKGECTLAMSCTGRAAASATGCNDKQTAFDTASATATQLDATAVSHKSAADTLTHMSDAVTGRNSFSPVAAPSTGSGNQTGGGGTPSYASGGGNAPYAGANGSSTPIKSPAPIPCQINDLRIECQVADYKKPASTGTTDPAGSTGSTGSSSNSSCSQCCNANDPVYGGTAQQVDALRGEQAKADALAKSSLARISKFFNNRRVGWDYGVIDGDYQTKQNLCNNDYCGFSYCDKNAALKNGRCRLYNSFTFKDITDYNALNNTSPSCPAFTLNYSQFGVQTVSVHCEILEKIRPFLRLLRLCNL